MTAYYNEIDPFAAEWLRELIKAGHIAPGIVDTRSIEDVNPADLLGFTQCHFFAGIGVWSYALRRAGWPDSRSVWTGSCPCQPFSSAGKRTGTADLRHLWPAWFHLINQCRPVIVFGEQVEAAIRHGWLDLVQADLEGSGYSCGPVCLPAAGFGAPHIRSRLYFVADAAGVRCNQRWPVAPSEIQRQCAERSGEHAQSERAGELSRRSEGLCGVSGTVADAEHAERRPINQHREHGCNGAHGGRQEAHGGIGTCGEVCDAAGAESGTLKRPERLCATGDLGHAARERCGETGPASRRSAQWLSDPSGNDLVGDSNLARSQGLSELAGAGGSECAAGTPGLTNGFWRDAEWLWCRDNKYRPVESGTFPLAHGATNRVGRLRGYGNAIVAPVAQAFIEAYLNATF